jgi:hypothetical protein
MLLFFYGRKHELRIIDLGDQVVDLNEQQQVKGWIQIETGIQVFSAVLSLVET